MNKHNHNHRTYIVSYNCVPLIAMYFSAYNASADWSKLFCMPKIMHGMVKGRVNVIGTHAAGGGSYSSEEFKKWTSVMFSS